MRIAIMQPYFIPYAGYFRLFAATDLFVIYDCVQFPRRGWVHRNRLPDLNGELDWLTLPIKKCNQDTKIQDLLFRDNASLFMDSLIPHFPSLLKLSLPEYASLKTPMYHFNQSVVDYLENLFCLINEQLKLPFNTIRSSTLNIPLELKAQDRILAIAEYFNATEYINAPNGRELYNRDDFTQRGINLRFLSDYVGAYDSILYRLLTESPDFISDEIIKQCIIQP